MLLVTVAALAGSLDDRTGAFLVTTTATVAAVGILLGGYLQRARNPVPPRRRTRSAAARSASMATTPPVDTRSLLADEPPWGQDAVPLESNVESPPAGDFPASDPAGEAILPEESGPSEPAASDALSPDATDPDPPAGSSIVVETPDSGIWQPADHTSGNGSEDTDSRESVDAQNDGQIALTARLTESSPSGADEEDPPPERRS
jgi:hypothetical protein